MAIKEWKDLQTDLKELLGDRSDDLSISFAENFTDTISDTQAKLADTTDWKAKYEENDKTWREKYRDRFFNTPIEDEPDEPPITDKKKPLRYEDLFAYK